MNLNRPCEMRASRFRRPWLSLGARRVESNFKVPKFIHQISSCYLPPPHNLPPGGPAHSAGPPRWTRQLCFWDILGLLFSIFGRLFSIFDSFFGALKIIKKTSSKKHAPKPQESGPWSPKCWFWHRFWDPFGIIFSSNFWFSHKMRQPPECIYT